MYFILYLLATRDFSNPSFLSIQYSFSIAINITLAVAKYINQALA